MNTKFHKNSQNSRNCAAGFTLVELIVAAVVLLVAIGAIVAVVRMGASMQISDQHRRQARTIVAGVFERSFSNFNPGRIYIVKDVVDGCAVITVPQILNDAVIEDDAYDNIITANNLSDECENFDGQSDSASISGIPIAFSDDGEPALRGNMTITSSSEYFVVSVVSPPTTPTDRDTIRVHVVEIGLIWTETNGAEDEIRFTKRLAGL